MNYAEYLELAKRIARHRAPAQGCVDPERARIELVRVAAQKLLAAKIEAQDREFLAQVGIATDTDLD